MAPVFKLRTGQLSKLVLPRKNAIHWAGSRTWFVMGH